MVRKPRRAQNSTQAKSSQGPRLRGSKGAQKKRQRRTAQSIIASKPVGRRTSARTKAATIAARRPSADHCSDVTVVFEGPDRRFEIHRGVNAKGRKCWYAVEMVTSGEHLHDSMLALSQAHARDLCREWIRVRG